MTDAESSKPQAKDGWTDAAGETVKEGKSSSNRRQRAKRLQCRRTLVRHKAAASRHEQRNTGREEHSREEHSREARTKGYWLEKNRQQPTGTPNRKTRQPKMMTRRKNYPTEQKTMRSAAVLLAGISLFMTFFIAL